MIKADFLEGVEEWNNHKYLLWQALELTSNSKLPVAEFGAGDGSTKSLRSYCNINNRQFISYESDAEWAKKCDSILINNWDTADIYIDYSVVLLDHANGERSEAAAILKDKAEIIILHDSEQYGNGNYHYKNCWWLFKYKLHLETGKTGATMLSNKINIVEKIL